MQKSICACLAVACLLIAGCKSEYVEFVPLRLKEGFHNELVPAPELMKSQEYVDGLKTVLEFYREDFRLTTNGTLLIKRSLNSDHELIWNYSKKASDRSLVSSFRNEVLSR